VAHLKYVVPLHRQVATARTRVVVTPAGPLKHVADAEESLA
jgi:hypothetical protein